MIDLSGASVWFLLSWFAIGLVLLSYGGEWLTRGAGALALKARISAMVVGLTVVAIATSMPELVTGIIAALAGSTDLAVGNIIGSNLCNLGLILGISALICPIAIQSRMIQQEMPVLLLVSILFTIMSMGGFFVSGVIGRMEGVALLLGAAAYIAFLILQTRRFSAEPGVLKVALEEDLPDPESLSFLACGFYILAGTASLCVGAAQTVDAAIEIAQRVGVSEIIIGLSVVAVGTSLPELAAAVAGARKKQMDMVAGNLVGSCVFNMLIVGGGIAAIHPLPVEGSLFQIEYPSMLMLTLLVWFCFYTGRMLTRLEGFFMLLLYFLILLLSGFFHFGVS